MCHFFDTHRILTWGRQPVILSFYSMTFLKAVALILTKVGPCLSSIAWRTTLINIIIQGKVKRQQQQYFRLLSLGFDIRLLSQHGHEEPDVLRCPHRRGQSRPRGHPQHLLAWHLCWKLSPRRVLPATQPSDPDPGHPGGSRPDPLPPLRAQHALCACPQLLQGHQGHEDDRPCNPLHLPDLHQHVLQLHFRPAAREKTAEKSARSVPLESQHIDISLKLQKKKVGFFQSVYQSLMQANKSFA